MICISWENHSNCYDQNSKTLLNSVSVLLSLSLFFFPFRFQLGMETPLDVLSRAASLVHADDEKRKSGIYFECFFLCAIIKF